MLQKQLKNYDLPLVMEPAGPEAVLMQGIDYVFVPSVMNTTDVAWLVGKHRAWVQQQKGKIPWEYIVPEAYIVLNPNSSVGKVTKSVCNLNADEVAAYVTVADHYFHFPIVYIEYSGTYGNPAGCESCFRCDRQVDPLLWRRDQLCGESGRDEQICRHDRGRERGLRPGRRGPESDRGRYPVIFYARDRHRAGGPDLRGQRGVLCPRDEEFRVLTAGAHRSLQAGRTRQRPGHRMRRTCLPLPRSAPSRTSLPGAISWSQPPGP